MKLNGHFLSGIVVGGLVTGGVSFLSAICKCGGERCKGPV